MICIVTNTLRDQLVNENLGLVLHTIRRLRQRYASVSKMHRDEAESAGNFALLQAAASYDQDLAQFSTYAVVAIRRAVLRAANGRAVLPTFDPANDVPDRVPSGNSSSREVAALILGRLRVRDRTIIERRFGLGEGERSVQELAVEDGVSRGTVHRRLQRAMAAARKIASELQPATQA